MKKILVLISILSLTSFSISYSRNPLGTKIADNLDKLLDLRYIPITNYYDNDSNEWQFNFEPGYHVAVCFSHGCFTGELKSEHFPEEFPVPGETGYFIVDLGNIPPIPRSSIKPGENTIEADKIYVKRIQEEER